MKYEPKYEDFLGKKFNHLEVLALLARAVGEDGKIAKVPNRNYPQVIKYLCKCDCGKLTVVSRNSLRDGTTHSCGCIPVGRPKGRKNFKFNLPLPSVGCGLEKVPCSKMKRKCCWDCDDYEACDHPCTNSPAKCGVYKG